MQIFVASNLTKDLFFDFSKLQTTNLACYLIKNTNARFCLTQIQLNADSKFPKIVQKKTQGFIIKKNPKTSPTKYITSFTLI